MRDKGRLDFRWIDRFPPVVLNHNSGPATALNIFFHASAENAILADDDSVPGGHKVGETGFHASRPGRRNGQGQRVFCLKGILQKSLDFIHQLKEERIQMANGWARKGA